MSLRLLKNDSIVRESSNSYYAGNDVPASLVGQSLLIHQRAMKRADTFLSAESDIIESLREVEDDATYLHFKLTSVHRYAMDVMKLSDDVACSMIAIMRKARKVPELAEAIRDGAITASKARKILTVINESNKDLWLELASTESSRVIEKAVAIENPKTVVQESIRYKSAERLELKLGISEEWEAQLKLIKDIASQKERRAVSTEEVLQLAMTAYLEKYDPLEKAKRAIARSSKKSAAETSETANRFYPSRDG